MVTFFTLPKPFSGLAKVHQTNAIRSWMQLKQGSEIYLFGNENGIEDFAIQNDLKHIVELKYNSYGTPLLNHAFSKVNELAKNDILCFINSDIILLPDFFEHIPSINFKKYLLLGHRWNLDIDSYINFDDDLWYMKFLEMALKTNDSSEQSGSDYFVFKKNSLKNMPPFAVGRPVWDNWMIYYFRKKGYPVINASETINIIHQNHNYQHVKSGSGHDYWGEEAEENIRLTGIKNSFYPTLRECSHIMANGKTIKKEELAHFLARPLYFKTLFPLRYKWLQTMLFIKRRLGRIIKMGYE